MTHVEVARFVIDRLSELGMRVNPSSRIGRMIACWFDKAGEPRFIPRDDPTFPVALQATRDLQQIAFILEQIESRPEFLETARSRLQRLMKDNVAPTEDTGNSPGRDNQCELYVAAICEKAKVSPRFDEPDVVVSFDGVAYGLAVKRVKSLDRLKERICEGANQVFDTKRTGILVADISLATNPEDDVLEFVISEFELRKALKKRTDKFVHDYRTRLVEWTRHKWVSGLVLLFHDLVAVSSEQYSLESFTATIGVETNARRRREFDEFAAQFLHGLATPAISSP